MRYVNTGLSIPSTAYRSKVYSTFRGMDAASAPQEVEDYRSPDMLNMIIRDGVPVKRPGYREKANYEYIHATILGLHRMPGALIVHIGRYLVVCPFETGFVNVPEWAANTAYEVGDCVSRSSNKYRCTEANSDASWTSGHWQSESIGGLIYGGMSMTQRSSSFYMNNALYILDGKRYTKVTKNGTEYTVSAVTKDAHVPITGVRGYYNYDSGEAVWMDCVDDEEKNLLTPYQINTFGGDGTNTEFWLNERLCTVTKAEILDANTLEWAETSDYTTAEDTTKRKTKITFTTAPDIHPEGAGLDNIRITFYRADDSGNADLINGCTLAAAYGYFNDNRVFLSGNAAYPNRDWASGIDDPAYIEENGWTNVGSDAAAIIGYLHYGDVLAIMKQDNNTDAEIYIRSGTVKEDGNILFPVQQGVKGVGAVSKGAFANLRDDALFLAEEGVYAVIGTDASQQKAVQNRSYFIDPLLQKEPGKDKAAAVVWNDRLLVCFPNGHCYVADARMRTGRSDNESFGYEWVRWDNIPASFFINEDGTLYFASEDGHVYRFDESLYTDAGTPIRAYWQTKDETFDVPGYYKTLLKRGTHVVLDTGGRVKVTAVTEDGETVLLDEDTEARGVRALGIGKKVPKLRTCSLKIENGNAEQLGIYGVSYDYVVTRVIK